MILKVLLCVDLQEQTKKKKKQITSSAYDAIVQPATIVTPSKH